MSFYWACQRICRIFCCLITLREWHLRRHSASWFAIVLPRCAVSCYKSPTTSSSAFVWNVAYDATKLIIMLCMCSNCLSEEFKPNIPVTLIRSVPPVSCTASMFLYKHSHHQLALMYLPFDLDLVTVLKHMTFCGLYCWESFIKSVEMENSRRLYTSQPCLGGWFWSGDQHCVVSS